MIEGRLRQRKFHFWVVLTQDFHLSSDGSTWDQTTGTNPPGVDWNQYDEELSGQPSLMFLDNPEATTGHDEPTATATTATATHDVEDSGAHPQSMPLPVNGIDSNQMWSSNENSVTFPVMEPTAAPSAPTTTNLDEPESAESTESAESAESAKSQSATDPDFHWNLHAPEFEFRPREVAAAQQAEAAAPVVADCVVPEERKLSATELLVRSSNDAQLAVLLAAANEDPDDEDVVDHMISPRSDVDEHHQHALVNGTV